MQNTISFYVSFLGGITNDADVFGDGLVTRYPDPQLARASFILFSIDFLDGDDCRRPRVAIIHAPSCLLNLLFRATDAAIPNNSSCSSRGAIFSK